MEQTILSGDERREKLLALLLRSDEPSVQKGIQSYRRHVAICMKKMLATKIAGGL